MRCRTLSHSPFNPLAVVAMVIGFLIAWPIGLAVLAYLLWGEKYGWRGRIDSFASGLREGLTSGRWGRGFAASAPFGSGNAAFDAYRARELARLEEERRRLDQERREFEAYMAHLRRARDQEEFDRFKAERSRRRDDGRTTV